MKTQNLFIAAFTFVALSANACPDLSGTYLCPKSQHHPDTNYTFSQMPHAADWLFTMTAQPVGSTMSQVFRFLTDGLEREVTEVNSGLKLLMTASCTASTLSVRGKANLDKPQPINFSEDLSLTPEGNLRNESLDINGNTIVETCLRQ